MKYLLIMSLFLTGCSAFHEKPLPPSESTNILLDVVWVDSIKEIPRTGKRDARGAAIWQAVKGQRKCTIYAFKPYNLDDFKGLQVLGHELLHCTDGNFHSPVNDKNFLEERRRMMQ